MNIGILGGGQLGRMIALSGYPLGFKFRVLDPSAHAPAGKVAQRIAGDYENEETLKRFTNDIDVVTYEFENVPLLAVRWIVERKQLYPPLNALEVSQDRLKEKRLFEELEIPTNRFMSVNSKNEFEDACDAIGFPSVIKIRRLGYDGKGQAVLHSTAERDAFWQTQEASLVPLILEEYVPFDRELSLIGVRSQTQEVRFYPLIENRHEQGILSLSLAPAPNVSSELQSLAETYVRRIMEKLNYIGVFTIEFFLRGDTLLANEMAPRVHNSGHWTMEGAVCSQFENHLRAITGLPLGATTLRGVSAMWNLLGKSPNLKEVLAMPLAHLHLYDKTSRIGRKLGHVTLNADSWEPIHPSLEQLKLLAPQQRI